MSLMVAPLQLEFANYSSNLELLIANNFDYTENGYTHTLNGFVKWDLGIFNCYKWRLLELLYICVFLFNVQYECFDDGTSGD